MSKRAPVHTPTSVLNAFDKWIDELPVRLGSGERAERLEAFHAGWKARKTVQYQRAYTPPIGTPLRKRSTK